MKLTYSLSKAYREQQFIKSGEEVGIDASVELPADALTPAMRAHLVRVLGGARVPSEFTLRHYSTGWSDTLYLGDRITLSAPATDARAAELFGEDMARWEAAEAERQARAVKAEAERQATAARQAKADAERKAEAERAAVEKAARAAEKSAWITEHGSDFLRQAFTAGYDCQRRYVTERAALEFPGYAVDFDDRAEWRERSCPSEKGLAEALAAGGTVVWLTRHPRHPADDGYGEDDTEYEAVAIRGFLGKYDLVKVI